MLSWRKALIDLLLLFGCCCVWLFATPWTAAHQVSLSLTISQDLPKFMSIESVMNIQGWFPLHIEPCIIPISLILVNRNLILIILNISTYFIKSHSFNKSAFTLSITFGLWDPLLCRWSIWKLPLITLDSSSHYQPLTPLMWDSNVPCYSVIPRGHLLTCADLPVPTSLCPT